MVKTLFKIEIDSSQFITFESSIHLHCDGWFVEGFLVVVKDIVHFVAVGKDDETKIYWSLKISRLSELRISDRFKCMALYCNSNTLSESTTKAARFVLLSRSPKSISEKIQFACTDQTKPVITDIHDSQDDGINSQNLLTSLYSTSRKCILLDKFKRVFKSIKYLHKINPVKLMSLSPSKEVSMDNLVSVDLKDKVDVVKNKKNTDNSEHSDKNKEFAIKELDKCHDILSSDVDPNK